MTKFHYEFAGPSDAEVYADMKLQSLVTDPNSYLDDIEKAAARTPEDWATTLSDESDVTILGYTEIEPSDLMGIVSVRLSEHRAYLHSLYISPTMRRNGFGRLLINAALDFAKADGRPQAQANTLYGNDPALRLFEKCGFRTSDGKLVNRRNRDRQFGEYTHTLAF